MKKYNNWQAAQGISTNSTHLHQDQLVVSQRTQDSVHTTPNYPESGEGHRHSQLLAIVKNL